MNLLVNTTLTNHEFPFKHFQSMIEIARQGGIHMGNSLKGKNVLITGGSHGIGKEIALELATAEANVAIVYGHNPKAAKQTVNEIEQTGQQGIAIQADLAKISQLQQIFNQAEAKLGKLDIFVSNAGGRIIAISSGGTRMLLSGTTLYLGSKGAIEQFIRGISQEVGSRQITANVVSPGFTDTGLLTDHFRKMAAGMSPFKRLGQPADIAKVVTFLASDQAGWVTGQNIGVGGGVMWLYIYIIQEISHRYWIVNTCGIFVLLNKVSL